MAYLCWNDSLSVNVPVIDEQHQQLVRLINQLHHAMTAGQGSRVLRETLDGLVDYAQVHFADEERYFDASAYPDSAVHKRQHLDFVERVAEFRQAASMGEPMLSLDLMDFLAEWLVEHIQGTDKSYVPYVTRQHDG